MPFLMLTFLFKIVLLESSQIKFFLFGSSQMMLQLCNLAIPSLVGWNDQMYILLVSSVSSSSSSSSSSVIVDNIHVQIIFQQKRKCFDKILDIGPSVEI